MPPTINAGFPSPGSLYQSQVSEANDSYANVMSGYQQALSGQQAGSSALGGQVANTLGYGGTPWGVAAPAAQAIGDTYAAQQGNAQQGLINSGLGNSTVLQSVNRGIGLDAAKAYGGLGAQLAQTYAGYQANIGMQNLNAQNQLRSQQLGYQGGFHGAGYSISPQNYNPRMYGGGGGGGPSGGSPAGAGFNNNNPDLYGGQYGGAQVNATGAPQMQMPGLPSISVGGGGGQNEPGAGYYGTDQYGNAMAGPQGQSGTGYDPSLLNTDFYSGGGDY
jgi:hypothetical protein